MDITGPDEYGSAYIYVSDTTKVKRTISVLTNLDLNENNEIVGVELLGIPTNVTFGK